MEASDDPAEEHDPVPDRSPATSGWRRALEIPGLVVFAAVVAILLKAFVAQAFFIPSASMEPQLRAGDRVVVSRLAYHLHEPRRGDVVVFSDPDGDTGSDHSFLLVRLGRDALQTVGLMRPDDKELIKRIIALPGETVEGHDNSVYIDGRPLIEPYLPDDVVISDFAPYRVPADHVFVMGDNRTNSKDSRFFKAVPVDSIVGRAIARIWPPGRIAYL